MLLAPLRYVSAQTAGREALAPGNYVTDGRRLFRVVSQFAADPRDRFASLEDCLTLDVHPYTPSELAAMKLRPVDLTTMP